LEAEKGKQRNTNPQRNANPQKDVNPQKDTYNKSRCIGCKVTIAKAYSNTPAPIPLGVSAFYKL